MEHSCDFRPTIALLQAWGISVLNPNKTKVQGGCDGTHPHLSLSFPYGQLTFGFKQVYSLSLSLSSILPFPIPVPPEPLSLLCGHGCLCP